jgi:transposase
MGRLVLRGPRAESAQLSSPYEHSWLHSMAQMTLITGAERRRRWSSEERQQILAEASAPGAIIAEVARRADVCTSLIYKWRREERRLESESGFSRVMLEDKSAPSIAEPEVAPILVELGGAQVKIGASASASLIAATLRALRS